MELDTRVFSTAPEDRDTDQAEIGGVRRGIVNPPAQLSQANIDAHPVCEISFATVGGRIPSLYISQVSSYQVFMMP